MKISGAQILIETLIEQGVDTVFGYPGGQVLNIYDELYKNSDRITHIITAHEQGAAHAADGYARVSGKVGVVIATSGPGATNLVTGIANAYLDSIPMVAITGNVPCALLGRDSFQEVDIMGITLPITKHNYVVKDTNKLADVIREAFCIAKSGRPGPVLIDIPKDIQINTAEYVPAPVAQMCRKSDYTKEQLERAAEIINQSERPYIYFGGGVIAAEAEKEVMQMAGLADAPMGCSMMGLSAIPSTNPRFLGMSGMHGHYASTKAKSESDCIIAIGVRFSDRATGNTKKFARDAKIVHIDIDPAEIDKNVPSSIGIAGDVKEVLTELNKLIEKKSRDTWQKKVSALKEFECKNVPQSSSALTPYDVIDIINERANADTPIVTDVGQHQMWTAQRYSLSTPRTFITSGGLGTMGFGMGAAIGAAIASGKRSVLFTGDGCFGMNLNELTTAVSQNVPMIVVIMNNGVLGMVRQWQTMFYDKHYSQTTLDRKTDFVKIAEAFGACGMRAFTKEELRECAQKAFAINGTVVIDCIIEKDERVLPMIPPNSSVENLIIN